MGLITKSKSRQLAILNFKVDLDLLAMFGAMLGLFGGMILTFSVGTLYDWGFVVETGNALVVGSGVAAGIILFAIACFVIGWSLGARSNAKIVTEKFRSDKPRDRR